MVHQMSSPSASPHAALVPDLLHFLKDHLRANIKGQDPVIERVCSVLVRGELGLAHPGRPKGSFLFVGPTGVGKTELTNVFTRFLFAGASPLRFDMSEYQLQKSVDKLIGENSSDRGLLGRAIGHCTRGTLLFDEIEKAHPLVLDLFLQILEDARITLATGETLNLSSFYMVCTSNIGSAEAMRMESAPFASIERTVLARVAQALRPELGGRVSDKLVFARLGYATQRSICIGSRHRNRRWRNGFSDSTRISSVAWRSPHAQCSRAVPAGRRRGRRTKWFAWRIGRGVRDRRPVSNSPEMNQQRHAEHVRRQLGNWGAWPP